MAGVEKIIVPDEHAGSLMAAASQLDGVAQLLDELLCASSGNSIHKAPIPPDWAGRQVRWAHQTLKEKHNAVLLSLERHQGKDRTLLSNPPPDTSLAAGDKLIFVAAWDAHTLGES